METAQSMTIEQAFYLLKHFTEIDFKTRKQFLEFGYSEKEINEQLLLIGSKFQQAFCQNPFQLESLVKAKEPIEQIIQSNGRIAAVYEFEEMIGTEQVVPKSNFNRVDIIQMDRNGRTINAVELKELPSTNQLVIVKSMEDIWITAFPGSYAPAFPSDWMTNEEITFASHFWQNHLFIISK
jgi:hypothetical protein